MLLSPAHQTVDGVSSNMSLEIRLGNRKREKNIQLQISFTFFFVSIIFSFSFNLPLCRYVSIIYLFAFAFSPFRRFPAPLRSSSICCNDVLPLLASSLHLSNSPFLNIMSLLLNGQLPFTWVEQTASFRLHIGFASFDCIGSAVAYNDSFMDNKHKQFNLRRFYPSDWNGFIMDPMRSLFIDIGNCVHFRFQCLLYVCNERYISMSIASLSYGFFRCFFCLGIL